MFYVGIDVASQKHDCCVLDDRGKVMTEFQISNSNDGFFSLEQTLDALDLPQNIKIGMEATGIYSSNLQAFLWRKGYETTTFNPLQINKRLSATTLRKTKTDKIDARFLASAVRQGDFQPDLPVSYHISELKSLTRFRFSLVQDRSREKIRAKAVLHLLFPEYTGAFSDPFGASAKAVLQKYPSPKALASCRISSLTALLKESSRGRFGEEKARELKELAKNSVGCESKALVMQMGMYLSQIEFFSEQIAQVEEQIGIIMEEIDSPILTIPGIGIVLGATILAEIGDIRRFQNPAKLLAFAGMEPSVYQSGKYSPESGKMVKRGSPYLRWALSQASRTVPKFSSTFARYFNKKSSENKHFLVASSHVAKKLVRILFAILSRNLPFSDSFSS